MKHLSLFIIVSLGLMAGSCGNWPGRAGTNGPGVSLDPTCVIDSLKTGKLYWFCKQTITSVTGIRKYSEIGNGSAAKTETRIQ